MDLMVSGKSYGKGVPLLRVPENPIDLFDFPAFIIRPSRRSTTGLFHRPG